MASTNDPVDSKDPIPPEVWTKLSETYFLGFDTHSYLEPLARKTKDLRPPFFSSANAFKSNMEALIEVVSMPISLASGTASEMRLQQLEIGERIRRLKIDTGSNLSIEDEQEAHRIAHEKLNSELSSDYGISQMGIQAWRFLHAAIQTQKVALAAHELIRQSAVLCWGALEVLARDVFATYMNTNPVAAIKVTDHPSTRGRFDLKAISIEVLAIHQFDVSNRMGDILLQHQDLTELTAIRDVYQVLFPDAQALRSALCEKNLWLLNQRRHLIVHKRGIVDQRYLDRTGDNAELGSVLKILPGELKDYLKLVRDAGLQILEVVSVENASTAGCAGL